MIDLNFPAPRDMRDLMLSFLTKHLHAHRCPRTHPMCP